ncbi:MAG: Gldg family protein [Pseudomonadota bacterium]
MPKTEGSAMQKSGGTGITLLFVFVLLAIVLVASNAVVNALGRRAQLDLTEDRLFTLSAGTREVLGSLEEPIHIRYFFSETASRGLTEVNAHARRVEDLLRSFDRVGGANVKLSIIKPEPDSPQEDEALAFGLQSARNPTSQDLIYFGVVASDSADGERLIPFLAPEREPYLEYDLTKLVGELAHTDRAKLAILSDLPLQFGPGGIAAAMQGNSSPYVIYQQLQQFFEVVSLDRNAVKIDEDVDLLLVAHAANLSTAAQYQIDQYILRGGRAMILVDPFAERGSSIPPAEGSFAGMQEPIAVSSNLEALFSAWGVSYDPDRIVADFNQAQQVSFGGQGRAPHLVEYLPWIGVNPDHVSKNDIITANLELVNVASAGALLPLPNADSADDGAAENAKVWPGGDRPAFEPLLQSSNVAALIDRAPLQGNPDPDALLRDTKPTGAQYTLAARLRGPAQSAFPDGPPKGIEAAAEGSGSAHLSKSASDINVVIVADADLIEDDFWAQKRRALGELLVIPFADNGQFLINALDNLSGSDALISLRSRGTARRPFTLIEALEREASAKSRDELNRLEAERSASEKRIAALEGEGNDGRVFSPQQLAELDRARAQVLETRKRLREVRRNLRADVETLKQQVIAINIAGVPLLLAIGVGAWGLIRRSRRRAV